MGMRDHTTRLSVDCHNGIRIFIRDWFVEVRIINSTAFACKLTHTGCSQFDFLIVGKFYWFGYLSHRSFNYCFYCRRMSFQSIGKVISFFNIQNGLAWFDTQFQWGDVSNTFIHFFRGFSVDELFDETFGNTEELDKSSSAFFSFFELIAYLDRFCNVYNRRAIHRDLLFGCFDDDRQTRITLCNGHSTSIL